VCVQAPEAQAADMRTAGVHTRRVNAVHAAAVRCTVLQRRRSVLLLPMLLMLLMLLPS